MANAYDIAYRLGLVASAPVWMIPRKSREKVLRALRERTGRGLPPRDTSRPAVMIHAVSLGEMNATRALVCQLGERDARLQFVVSATTDTGFARARELYGADPRVSVIRYPLDFSGAIRRVLDALRPSVVVLMELEVWPNFVRHCCARGIPVVLVNGRLTEASFRGYRRARPLLRRTFARLAVVCVQEEAYARRFTALGVPPDRVRVTGTMKFDTADVTDRVAGDDELARALGLAPLRAGDAQPPSPGTPGEGGGEGADADDAPIWVAGSTGPGEEEIVLRVYRELLKQHPGLRLAIIPRHPQRFDDAAKLIEAQGFPLLRRSSNPQSAIRNPQSAPVLLGDTMGELRRFYSLATVVFVGRTLVDLGPKQHGSDMIEPAALAKPVVVGPFTGNFAEVMSRFRDAGAMVEVADEAGLLRATSALLADRTRAATIGGKAQAVVAAGKGSTARHVEVILAHLPA
jgi:3-deoxy-D-manno-octulosonic-acid transferase